MPTPLLIRSYPGQVWEEGNETANHVRSRSRRQRSSPSRGRPSLRPRSTVPSRMPPNLAVTARDMFVCAAARKTVATRVSHLAPSLLFFELFGPPRRQMSAYLFRAVNLSNWPLEKVTCQYLLSSSFQLNIDIVYSAIFS